jgi:hypothetical protein
MKKIVTPLFALAAAALINAGCSTPAETGAYPPHNATKFDLENQASVVFMDPGAQQSVTCTGLQIKPLADGRLEVNANMRNRENRRVQVQINCEFKDEQGFVVDSTPFQTLILTENAQEGVSFQSMNSQAKKYTLRVREAR